MFNPEFLNKRKEYLDPISQIRIDSNKGIETIFITNKKLPDKKEIKHYYFDKKISKKDKNIDLENKDMVHYHALKEAISSTYFDSKLLNKKEALEYAKKHNIKINANTDQYNFFIYHQNLGIIPFEKGDYIMTDEGYTTTDGKHIICYDNNGDELGFF